MRLPLAAAFALALTVVPAAAGGPVHPCEGDAAARALKLLELHTDGDDRAEILHGRTRPVGTVRALRGQGRLDVIEVWGGVYKATYRMRLVYARIPGSCVLMGQEILEESDPY